MSKTTERPHIVEDEHLEFLDQLQESATTNMFGAATYLRYEYPNLSKPDARKVLMYWMESFGERHTD